MLTASESVARMTDDQIAESLELTPRCLKVYEKQHSFPEDRLASHDGALLIRRGKDAGCDASVPIQRLGKLADLLEQFPVWRKRALVYRRAVQIIEQI